jgi:hypothetical protein
MFLVDTRPLADIVCDRFQALEWSRRGFNKSSYRAIAIDKRVRTRLGRKNIVLVIGQLKLRTRARSWQSAPATLIQAGAGSKSCLFSAA